jgi:hypothetical protein
VSIPGLDLLRALITEVERMGKERIAAQQASEVDRLRTLMQLEKYLNPEQK